MRNTNQSQSNSTPAGSGQGAPASQSNAANAQGGARPRPSAMRETTHVKVATRSAMERQVRTTIDLKRPWYYSA